MKWASNKKLQLEIAAIRGIQELGEPGIDDVIELLGQVGSASEQLPATAAVSTDSAEKKTVSDTQIQSAAVTEPAQTTAAAAPAQAAGPAPAQPVVEPVVASPPVEPGPAISLADQLRSSLDQPVAEPAAQPPQAQPVPTGRLLQRLTTNLPMLLLQQVDRMERVSGSVL